MAWAPDYVSLAEVRDYVRITDGADVDDDPDITDAIAGASRAIDSECQRQFGNSGGAEVRYYTPRWSKTRNGWLVATDDIPAAAGLLVDLDTAADGSFATPVSSFLLRPSNSLALGRPFEGILLGVPAGVRVLGVPEEVRVSALTPGFGWAAVPTAVKLATKMQAARLLARRDSPFGVAGSPEVGSELRLLAKVDPDVAVTLKHYRRRVRLR